MSSPVSNQGTNIAVVDVLRHAGFDQLGPKPTDDAVQAVLRALGAYLADITDPLVKELCIVSAVGALRIQGYCNAAAGERIVRAALAAADSPGAGGEEEWRTFGKLPDGSVIVDFVLDGQVLKWLVAYPPGLRMPASYVTGQQRVAAIVDDVAGRRQWPRAALPWTSIPHAGAVEIALTNQSPAVARELAYDLVNLFRRPPRGERVILPEPNLAWAVTLAVWILGTYLHDGFRYWPIVLLEGPPARGKTRIGKMLAFLSWRGMVWVSATTSPIFRNRQRHRLGIFLDVMDLPGRMARNDDLNDIALNSYERDAVVPRVSDKAGVAPPEQMIYYEVYGPTVFATNVRVRDEHPLIGRCLRFTPPEAGKQYVLPALRPDDDVASDLRARLTAWAAHTIGSGITLPNVPSNACTGRVRDIATPLLQVTRLVLPEWYDLVLQLLQGAQTTGRIVAAESWEGRVVTALEELRQAGHWSTIRAIGYEQIEGAVNRGVDDKNILTTRRIGRVVTGDLNLTANRSMKAGQRQYYVVYPGDEAWTELLSRYGANVTGNLAKTDNAPADSDL